MTMTQRRKEQPVTLPRFMKTVTFHRMVRRPKLVLILVKTTQPQEMIQEMISVATMRKVNRMNQMQQIPRMLSSEPAARARRRGGGSPMIAAWTTRSKGAVGSV